jgi:peptidoglycan/LPS O-acetylase OafA/YrhL
MAAEPRPEVAVASPAALAAPEPTPAPPSRLRGFFALDLLDNRFPSLHGLRFLAIISVVQYHVSWIYAVEQGIPLDLEALTPSLSIFFGMDLFFLLSGFLIGSILLRSIEVQGSQQLRRFYIRRVFRTFPSYYLVLAFLTWLLWYQGWLTPVQRHNLWYEATYLTNFRTLGRTEVVMLWGWSLALEEQFYLTVPLLFFVLQRLRSDRARVALLLILWASALAVRLVLFYRLGPWDDLRLSRSLYFKTYTRYDTLVAGILLALVHQRWRKPITAWLEHPLHRALIAMPSLLCLWLLLRPWLFGWEHTQLVKMFLWGTVTTLMWFGFLILLLHGEGIIGRFLSWPWFRRLATLGYGVYLVHIPLIDWVCAPLAHRLARKHVTMWITWPLSLTVAMIASLIVGYVLHVLVEKPSLRIRDWLAA